MYALVIFNDFHVVKTAYSPGGTGKRSKLFSITLLLKLLVSKVSLNI